MRRGLTAVLVDGRVHDLIVCDDTVGFRRLRPAHLSDSGADDVKGKAARLTGA